MAERKKDRSTNNDLQNTTQKTKDPATRTNTKKWGWGTHVPQKGFQFLLHKWHP